MEYNKQLCEEKHINIEKKINEHEVKINEHEIKIDGLTTTTAVNSSQIDKLCGEISGLVSTLKWVLGFAFSSLFGFFIFVLKEKLFK